MQEPNEEIAYAYFLESGLASVVVRWADGNTVETGITGKKGSWVVYIAGHQQHAHGDFHSDSGHGLQNQSQATQTKRFENSGTLAKQTHRYIQAHLCKQGRRPLQPPALILPSGLPLALDVPLTEWNPITFLSRTNSCRTCWELRGHGNAGGRDPA